jgi:hypothetical protein
MKILIQTLRTQIDERLPQKEEPVVRDEKMEAESAARGRR